MALKIRECINEKYANKAPHTIKYKRACHMCPSGPIEDVTHSTPESSPPCQEPIWVFDLPAGTSKKEAMGRAMTDDEKLKKRQMAIKQAMYNHQADHDFVSSMNKLAMTEFRDAFTQSTRSKLEMHQ